MNWSFGALKRYIECPTFPSRILKQNNSTADSHMPSVLISILSIIQITF
jgi:hypothetical protein